MWCPPRLVVDRQGFGNIDFWSTVTVSLALVWAPTRWLALLANRTLGASEKARMKLFSTSFTLSTEERTEISDITKLVRETLQQLPVSEGIALINTLHTTCALFINEFQAALIDDLKGLIERLVPERGGYRHDDPRYSDCERGNAHSHLRAALLGRNIAVGVSNGDLSLGRFQSIIFAELDGPRKREITVQVIGE
jgi:secondary thiamine-phosphate synthase enzyme